MVASQKTPLPLESYMFQMDNPGPAPRELGGPRRAGMLFLASRQKFAKFFENFANFWRARSRLYQNEILQENMRSTAFSKLYKICILLHRRNLKIFTKNRFEKNNNFREISAKRLQMSQNLQIFVRFRKFQLENLVDFFPEVTLLKKKDFEKCCKTHIFLQKSEPIQPKTSNILPNFCQPTLSDALPCASKWDCWSILARRGCRSPLIMVAPTCASLLSRDPTNFRGLVLGCIEAKFCK